MKTTCHLSSPATRSSTNGHVGVRKPHFGDTPDMSSLDVHSEQAGRFGWLSIHDRWRGIQTCA